MLLGALEEHHHRLDRTEATDIDRLDYPQHRQDLISKDHQDLAQDPHADHRDQLSRSYQLDQHHLLACRRRRRYRFCPCSPAYRRQFIQGDPYRRFHPFRTSACQCPIMRTTSWSTTGRTTRWPGSWRA